VKKAFTGSYFLLIGFAYKNATEKGEKQGSFFGRKFAKK